MISIKRKNFNFHVIITGVLIFLFVLSLCAPIRAQDVDSKDKPEESKTLENLYPLGSEKQTGRAENKIASTGKMIAQAVKALIVVLILLCLVIFALKFFMGRSKGVSVGTGINVINRTFLTPKISLYLVKVGDRIIMLSVGPDTAEKIAEITDPEEISVIENHSGGSAGIHGSAFMRHFQKSQEAISKDLEDETDGK